MRIAIAGFQHETNTFAPGRAGIEAFHMADSWPGLLQGEAIVTETRGLNLPIAGAVAEAKRKGSIELVPILWCAAEPSGPVTDEAFETITEMLLSGLRDAGPLDAIYLDLHGAMVTKAHDDGEGALLARIRANVPPNLPIGISLDLHANISARMVDLATVITVYRTYPHLDMAETGARCLGELCRSITGPPRTSAFRQAPFLVPLHAQHTGSPPCRSLYRLLDELPVSEAEFVELAMGFTAADVYDCGPSVLAYAQTHSRAAALADHVFNRLCASEGEFDTRLFDAADAVRLAVEAQSSEPIILADVQDNPGAGGTGDTTGLLHALIECAAPQALLGVVCDAEMAERAHRAGLGAVVSGGLGGKSNLPGPGPVLERYKVLALSDGQIEYTGAMYGGGMASIGPSCLLLVETANGDIRVVVSSRRTQCLDRALFTHFGADPTETAIVGVKSTVHFRADFETDGVVVLNVAVPGAFSCRLSELAYERIRPGVRLGPHGPAIKCP